MLRRGLAPALRTQLGQEDTKMVLDMTAQLAPVMWGMVMLLVVSMVSVGLSHK